jgi:ADP-heptose:LPS heptosyltransferase
VNALVVSTGGGIGDVLLATPVMRALRARYERVVALTAPAHAEVLSGNPDLADVLLDDAPFGTVRNRIARGKFDAAIVTWATLRSAALPFAAGVPVRVGQSRRLYSFLFNRRVTVRSELGDRTTHWTQVLLDYARALGCDALDATPAFVFGSDAVRDANALVAGVGISGGYAVLHPTRGIAAARARWPTERLGQLGRALRDSFGVAIVVTGDAADGRIAASVAAAAGARSVAGRTTIKQFGALAAGARFVVAMDSGPMHLAAAVGAPTVGIFALQSDEPDRWRPLGPRTEIVRPSYPCPPSHRKETCPDFACIRELPIPPVLDAVTRVIG